MSPSRHTPIIITQGRVIGAVLAFFVVIAILGITRPHVQDSRSSTAKLLDTINRGSPGDREKAFEHLATSSDQASFGILMGYLDDDNAEVRETAARWLGKCYKERAYDTLTSRFEERDRSYRTLMARAAEARALGDLGDQRACDLLLECLQDRNETPGVRGAAGISLGKLKDARSFPILMSFILPQGEEPEWGQDDLLQPGVVALGHLGDQRAVKPLIALLGPEHDLPGSGEQVECAAWALGRLGDTSAIPPLVDCLHSFYGCPSIPTALERLGWKPSSETDLVCIWLCSHDYRQARDEWRRVSKVLVSEMELVCHQLEANEHSAEHVSKKHRIFRLFVKLDPGESNSDTIAILDRFGDLTMADFILNGPDEDLMKAARDWGLRHGYRIETRPRR